MNNVIIDTEIRKCPTVHKERRGINPYQQGKEDMELISKLCVKYNGMFIVSQRSQPVSQQLHIDLLDNGISS